MSLEQLKAPSFRHKHETEGVIREWFGCVKLQRPSPVTHLLHQGHTSSNKATSPNPSQTVLTTGNQTSEYRNPQVSLTQATTYLMSHHAFIEMLTISRLKHMAETVVAAGIYDYSSYGFLRRQYFPALLSIFPLVQMTFLEMITAFIKFKHTNVSGISENVAMPNIQE